MNRIFQLSIANCVLAATLLLSGTATAFQTPKKDTTQPAPNAAPAATKAAPAAAPSASDIADAKAKGLVWVNLSSKVYHKEGAYYGKTKEGKFMTEADAIKAGYRAAKEPAPPKKKTPAPTK